MTTAIYLANPMNGAIVPVFVILLGHGYWPEIHKVTSNTAFYKMGLEVIHPMSAIVANVRNVACHNARYLLQITHRLLSQIRVLRYLGFGRSFG